MFLIRGKIKIGFIIFFFFFSSTIFGREIKIGYVDSQRILEQYKGTQDIQKQFAQEISNWQNEVEKRKKEISDLETELQTQSLLLSQEKRKEKEQTILQKKGELQKFVEEIWGKGGKAQQKNEELSKPVLEKINTIIRKIANDEGYTIILDASAGNLIYASKELDITDEVIETLEKETGYLKMAKIKIATFPFKEEIVEAENKNYGKGLFEMLISAFQQQERFEIMEKMQIYDFLKEKGFQKEAPPPEDKALSFGEDLGAEAVALGRVSLKSKTFTLEIKLFKTITKELITTEQTEVIGEDNLPSAINDLARRLAEKYR
ncbi:MAG: OmpH family outer membrane protein [Candidatus Edwardsbacteria bacterium]